MNPTASSTTTDKHTGKHSGKASGKANSAKTSSKHPSTAANRSSESARPSTIEGPSDWFKDAVIYELHVRAFADSNGDGVGDLDGLRDRLDYLADLGVTAIWMLPFYPSPGRDDGYDIADYDTVNPDYGTTRSFQRFLDAAHERGLRVITELVINHTSDQHPWFERARRAPKGSPERDFYVWSDDPEVYADARIIFQDFETSNWTWDPVAGQYYWHRFYSHQPDLNFDNPAVEQAVLDVLDRWLDMGVDGLRLDAVPYLYEREGTTCENLPETHDALKRIRAHMDTKYEGRMLLAEANQWPEDAAAYFGDDDECHMNFHFPVMPRLFMSVQMENRTPITDIMEQTPVPPPGCQWATFLRNHDELTLEMVTEEERDLMLRAYARDDEMRINLGIRRRLAPLLGNDRRKIELLNVLLFSLPGTPVVYYGDEIGMGDNVYLGDRDGVRTPMQWTADRNAGFSTSNPHRLYLPLITEQEYHYESINVETQSRNPASLLSWMRQLIALRNRHPVLGRGDIEFHDPENPHVLAFSRSMPGEASMLCVANLSRLAQHVDLDLSEHVGATPVEVFGRNRFAPVGEHPYSLTLAPYGFFWLSLEHADHVADRGDLPHLPGTLEEVARRRAALTRALTGWLPERRWYAGKDKSIREVKIDTVIPIGDDLLVTSVLISFTDGDDQRYAVPMLRVTADTATTVENLQASSVIARLDDGALLIDAMTDARGVAQVIGAAATEFNGEQGAHRLAGHAHRDGIAHVAADWRDVHILGVEQSNSSAIVDPPDGPRLIAKLVRRLEVGPNPDVVLPRHLVAAGFERVPGVASTLDLALADETDEATLLVVHDAVEHERDLWAHLLDDLSLTIDNDVLFGADSVDIGIDTVTTAIAELLGTRTAELHRSLASGSGPALAPEPFTLQWQRSVIQTVRNSVRAAQRELRRRRRSSGSTPLSERAAELAELVIERGDDLIARFDSLVTARIPAKRIRIHGDLHLGQILWTGSDVVFIDFEGEPGQPIGQRSIKRSPLADVAGLLRSVDYAGRVAVHTAVERGRIGESDLDAVERWRTAWTTAMHHRLLSTYRSAIVGADLVPDDDAELELLLDVYLVTKSLYEVRYELANRPEWVSWPLEAVGEMIRGGLTSATAGRSGRGS
ncbi:MAG: maltose alpha-D-glucosyltransferase [Ilumatobacter sp.]|uniref:maltose alpha-D-glucosyltransferase n=1 Tax=Ilumatobacter sp. TaxID=1967498 RepID=UPI00391CE233